MRAVFRFSFLFQRWPNARCFTGGGVCFAVLQVNTCLLVFYVTGTSEEIPVASVEHRGTGEFVAKAKPRPKPTFTLSPVSILFRERKWIDVDPGKFSQGCFEVLKFIIRLLRHDDTEHREDDGAVRFDDLAEKFKAKFDGSSQWSIEAWITFLAKGGGPKKLFQHCLNPKFFQTFPVFPSNPGTFRRYSR